MKKEKEKLVSMASEYEKLRLRKMSLNREALGGFGIRELMHAPPCSKKRKTSLSPEQPTRQSERIHELVKRKTPPCTTTKPAKKEEKKPKNNTKLPKAIKSKPKDSKARGKTTKSSEDDDQSPKPQQKIPKKPASIQRQQVAPVSVDTSKMFSPIKAKVGQERKYDEEWYTEEDLQYLGSCKQRYPYMGVAKVANIHGTMCHQCHQKTRDKKTTCSVCKGPNGVLCGQCLQIRYGENILEVFQKLSTWVCPSCRGICNCNACREMKNLPPIGAVCVNTLKFPSVAHWVMSTHLMK